MDLKRQEETISDMGKEWDGIHKSLKEELDELKETTKTREEALTAGLCHSFIHYLLLIVVTNNHFSGIIP